MEADQLIDELLEATAASETYPKGQEEPSPTQVSACDYKGNVQKHREQLAALAVGGQARQYGLAVRGNHSPLTKLTLWTIAKSRGSTPAAKQD